MPAKVIALPSVSRLGKETPCHDLDQRTTLAELRRARIRIAQLEASLTEAMRDSLANFNRARDAEQMLARHRR